MTGHGLNLGQEGSFPAERLGIRAGEEQRRLKLRQGWVLRKETAGTGRRQRRDEV